MKLRLLLLSVFLFFYGQVFSETFVVTSNADAGVGTLRDALTKAAANGIAEKDYIHFDLPGATEVDRTITLATALPYISSNLVLDGTTQPGDNLGVSNAKVILQPQNSLLPFNAFVLIDVDGFEIYGFYVRDFMGPTLNGPAQEYSIAAALYVENTRNIQIGAPGKGNVFANNGFILSTFYASLKTGVGAPPMGVENLKVYSNFFGFEPDGKTFRGTIRGYVGGIDLAYCKGTIEIGGKEDTKRNIFGNGTHYISGKYTTPNKYFPTEFLIENNYFGYNVDGDPVLLPSFNGNELYAVHFNLSPYIGYTAYAPYSFKILNNKLQTSHSIIIKDVLGQLVLQGNVFKRETLPNNPSYKPFFWLFTKDIVKVGGLLDGEANSIENGQLMLGGIKSTLVQRNSLYCVNIRVEEEVYNGPVDLLPKIEITNVAAGSVSGTATPNSKVELFWDDDCKECHPLTYFATVTADENGLWKFEGTVERGVIASATYNGFTSHFTITHIYQYPNILHSTCGEGNGSITGQRYRNAGGYQWRNEANEIVGSNPDVSGLLPGKYVLSVLNGSCTQRFTFDIVDGTPEFNTSSVQKINPSCGANTGAITNLSVNYNNGISYPIKWYDQDGNIRGTEYNLRNVEAGTYYAEVSYNSCTVRSPNYTLTNQTGPNINQSAPDVAGSSCNTPTGYIKNVLASGSGTLTYKWKNAAGQVVGTAAELINVPAGQYTLEVKDGSACPALVSAPITVPEINGITINTANKVVDKATCNTSNGGITGITTSGATDYKWLDEGGTTVATTLNLTGMPAGKYRLVASNAVCSKTSEEITIALAQSTLTYGSTKILTPASCGLSNGKIEAIFTNAQPASCFWKNSAGVVVGHSRILTDQPPGSYDLYIVDDLGCERFAIQYAIGNVAGATINRNLEQVSKDQCGQGKGRIKAPGLSGGQLPYFYQWKDENGTVIGTNAVIDGLKAGVYQLTIGDALDCSRQTISYTIEDEISTLPVPAVNDVKICSAGNAVIQVIQPQNGTYMLYSTDGTLIAQNTTGSFNVTVKGNQNFNVVLRKGSCESPAASAKVTVANDGLGELPNAFSPNGDGHNDHWTIPGMESYPDATVAIYNRYGHKVFESTGYKTPFNGKRDGTDLPVGVYYYIIDLKRGCGLQKGSLTLVK